MYTNLSGVSLVGSAQSIKGAKTYQALEYCVCVCVYNSLGTKINRNDQKTSHGRNTPLVLLRQFHQNSQPSR